MSKYVDGIEFVTEQCCNCGIAFAVTSDFQNRRMKDHKSFYCPAGHGQHYSDKSEEQRLREQLEQKQQELSRAQTRAESIARQRDQVSKTYHRMRERVKNGVCPCCNRTFENLMNHMRTKHPDYGNHDMLRTLRGIYGLTQEAAAKEIGVEIPYISLFERQKKVPAYANGLIESWLESQDSKQ